MGNVKRMERGVTKRSILLPVEPTPSNSPASDRKANFQICIPKNDLLIHSCHNYLLSTIMYQELG